MANKIINMGKLRQIIKLYCQHMGTRKISEATGVSRNTVKKYIRQFKFLKTTWEEFFMRALILPVKKDILLVRQQQICFANWMMM